MSRLLLIPLFLATLAIGAQLGIHQHREDCRVSIQDAISVAAESPGETSPETAYGNGLAILPPTCR